MTTMLVADGVQDWLSDASDDVLKRIAAGAVNANQWMMLKAIDQINTGLRINLGADWLQDVLGMMRYLVLPVVGLLAVILVLAFYPQFGLRRSQPAVNAAVAPAQAQLAAEASGTTHKVAQVP